MRHNNGGYRWVLSRSVLRMTKEGVPARALSLFSDVTEEVEEHNRHRALVAAIPDTVLRIGAEGRILDLRPGGNKNESRLLGGARIEGSLDDLLNPEFASKLRDLIRDALTGQALKSLDWACGWELSTCHFELRVTPSGMDEVVCIIRDVTELKLLESQLLQSQKLESIGQLAAGIAHEINTPAQFLGDNTRFLQSTLVGLLPLLDSCARLSGPAMDRAEMERLTNEVIRIVGSLDLAFIRDEVPRALDESLDGISRISGIVRAMKEYSHPGSKSKQPTDLNRCIESTVTVARNEWKYIARLQTDLAPDLPLVPCYPQEVNQVLLNMIVNAVHAIEDVRKTRGTEELGLIRIVSQRDGDVALIRISDDGCGIPEAIRARIFDPFFTTKEVGRGSGQGLTIAHSVVVEKHGGRIDVESRVGAGTVFSIRLPLAAPRETAAAA
jgi:signal transduction histidine kinase